MEEYKLGDLVLVTYFYWASDGGYIIETDICIINITSHPFYVEYYQSITNISKIFSSRSHVVQSVKYLA